MKSLSVFFVAVVCTFFPAIVGAKNGALAARDTQFVLQKSNDLPVTTINLTFRVGSADDPSGQEGIAALTADLMREGGVQRASIGGVALPARSRAELEDFLYPMAADIQVTVENEQTSFHVTTTAEDAETVFRALVQLVLKPAFDGDELSRLKNETIDALEKQLPREDEEEVGKAALDQLMYGRSHPYGHVVAGTLKSVRALEREQVQAFYLSHYTQKRLWVGLGGVVSPELERLARAAFAELPVGDRAQAIIPAAPKPTGLRLQFVQGSFDAVGVHLGTPLSSNRASRDFPELFLASWAFGKHRSFVGRLMHEVREVRGLNYGDYAYVEFFPHGGQLLNAPPQAARTRQAFTVWGRPTPPENGCFLVRELLRETNQLAKTGLSESEFALTRSHLIGNAPLLATGMESRLGFAIDSRFYGIDGDFLKKLQQGAKSATRERVNAVLRAALTPGDFNLVVVGADTGKLEAQLKSPFCAIHYAAGVKQSAAVHQQDAAIGAYPVPVQPQNTTRVTAESLFAE